MENPEEIVTDNDFAGRNAQMFGKSYVHVKKTTVKTKFVFMVRLYKKRFHVSFPEA